ncbi:unnamed protein product, partial [Laminaria digitata]
SSSAPSPASPSVGAAAATSPGSPPSPQATGSGSEAVPDLTYGPYRRTSGDGLLGVEWPRCANGTAISGFINDERGIRYIFSFTLSCQNGHTDIAHQWYEKIGEFAHLFCNRAAIGLERGGIRRILHVQAVLEIGINHRGAASKVTAALREKLRKICGLVGAKIILKELERGQSFERESLHFSCAFGFPSQSASPFSRFASCHSR